jgi:hypothetical protein
MKEVQHLFLVGAADPTGSIPNGYIFVPGIMGVKQGVLENLCDLMSMYCARGLQIPSCFEI